MDKLKKGIISERIQKELVINDTLKFKKITAKIIIEDSNEVISSTLTMLRVFIG